MNDVAIDAAAMALANLHDQARRGDLFGKLGEEVGKVVASVPQRKRTRVVLPRVSTGYKKEIERLAKRVGKQPLPGISDDFLQQMLTAFQVRNWDVRARWTYYVWSTMLATGVLTDSQIQISLQWALSPEHLYSHVLEPDNNAVFTRAMALAMIVLFLYTNARQIITLPDDNVRQLGDAVALLTVLEHDTRGFVRRDGWAHMIIELANAHYELVHQPQMTRGDNLFFLTTVIESYRNLTTPVVSGEGEQLAMLIVELLNRHKIYRQYFKHELRRWAKWMDSENPLKTEQQWTQLFNYRRLMQALLVNSDLPDEIGRLIANGGQQTDPPQQ